MRPLPALRRWAARHSQAGQMVAMVLLVTAVWGAVLVALPFVLTVVGALLPIAAIGLLVRYVLRLHWRRRP